LLVAQHLSIWFKERKEIRWVLKIAVDLFFFEIMYHKDGGIIDRESCILELLRVFRNDYD